LVLKNENIPNTNDNLSEEKSKKNVSHNKTEPQDGSLTEMVVLTF
jgi:hypothetical protein